MTRLVTKRGKAANAGPIALAIALSSLMAGCASHDASIHAAPLKTAATTAARNDRNPPFMAAFYVGSHGWHTSIIVPRAAISKNAWPAGVVDRTFRDCSFLEAGWGDRKFYMAPRPNVSTALDAVFLPGASVLHMVGLDPPLESALAWSGLVRMPCNAAELQSVCRAIGATFAPNAHRQIQALGPGLYGRISRFYPAHGRYYFANTCNNWTARIMRAGGFPADVGPAGTWTAGAVMAQARRLGKTRSAGSTALVARENDQRAPILTTPAVAGKRRVRLQD
ncbi:MAG: DUF2459 domain-containing protein [Chthoniobacterales bacterium]|nr:DUF2459 domain-containing protein [Chthoniobacterales bacterium]